MCVEISVSPWSVSEREEALFSVSEVDSVAPQSFSFSRKRQAFVMESQGDLYMASSPEDVQPLSTRNIQEVDCGADQRWAAVYQSIARRMDHSEVLKVNTRELEHQCLHQPNRVST